MLADNCVDLFLNFRIFIRFQKRWLYYIIEESLLKAAAVLVSDEKQEKGQKYGLKVPLTLGIFKIKTFRFVGKCKF